MTVQERLYSRIKKNELDCWVWQGCVIRRYGGIKIAGKMKRAHRISWELTNGPIPDGLFVCHHCDVPLCINPDHLFLGTHTDNMRDMIKKGRKSKIVWNTNKTHCKQGHTFNEQNTRYYVWKDKEHRCCRTCDRLRPRREKSQWLI